MDPASLIPITEPIQVHWALSDGFLVATFILHILLMNVLVGGGLMALVYMGRDDGPSGLLSRRLPTILALTVNFGVAPLLFLQVNYGHFDYVSSVIMGGWWLAVIPILIVGYYCLYIFKYRHEPQGFRGRPVLFLALMCIFYVGFMFSNNMSMMLEPEKWLDYFSSGMGTSLYTDRPVLYPRFLHFMAASLAVGGLFTALLGRYGNKPKVLETGMAWFTWATVVNICLGIWFLISLPNALLLKFMGGDTLATTALGLAAGGGVLLVVAGLKRYTGLALVLTICTVGLMSFVRHLLRYYYLEPHYRVQDVAVTGQYSPLYVALGFLAVGLVLIVYMLRLYAKAMRGA